MQANTIKITDAALLRKLQTRRLPAEIFLELNGLGPDEALTWQRQLNKHYSDCGCSTGTVFVLVTISATLLSFFTRLWYGKTLSPWLEGLILLALFLMSAGTGKAVGLWRARRRLEKTVEELIKELGRREFQDHTEAVGKRAIAPP